MNIYDDQRERGLAVDPTRSIIVRAPAGSGKTELLTQRYLNLLAVVDAPEQILAITFTNKAAAEMRQRILRALARAADGTSPTTAHQISTYTYATAAHRRALQRGWRLEATPARLRVLTIDAFCRHIASGLPVTAAGGQPLRVAEDPAGMLSAAAWETLAEVDRGLEWSSAVEYLLRYLGNDTATIAALIEAMLAGRDKWLRHLLPLRAAAGDSSIHEIVTSAMQRMFVERASRVLQLLDGNTLERWMQAARVAADRLCVAGKRSAIVNCLDRDAVPTTDVADHAVWLGLTELFLTKEGCWRASINALVGLPAPKNGRVEPSVTQATHAIASTLLAEFRDNPALLSALRELRSTPSAHLGDGDRAVLTALAELLSLAAAHLRLQFQQQGAVDFTEVTHQARLALDPDQPQDIGLWLDQRICHILVDEFQDTNYTQYELLERLMAGWQPGDGRTLFVVGDPMQSIYRFREGDVGLFLQASTNGIGTVALEPVTLRANFRSVPALVDWLNDAFPNVFPAESDAALGAIPYTPAAARRAAEQGDDGVTVHPLVGRDDSAEADLVVALVRAAMAAEPSGSIAVLVRARSHLTAILPAFEDANLPYQAVELAPLAALPLVQDLMSLSLALLQPADDLAWAAVLRSPLCGASSAELAQFSCAAGGIVVPLLAAARSVVAPPALSAGAKRLVAVLREIWPWRGRLPWRTLVECAWLQLGGAAVLRDESEQAATTAYFDQFERWIQSVPDPATLRDAASRWFATPPLEPAQLQVMTIHKAKGLEFDTVIVAGMGRPPHSADKRLLYWQERPVAGSTPDLLVGPIAAEGQPAPPLTDYLKRIEREKNRLEAARLLYVAATRARRRLHLIGHVPKCSDGTPGEPKSGSLLHCVWPAVHGVFATATVADHVPDATDNTREMSLLRLPANFCSAIPSAPATTATTSAASKSPAGFEQDRELAQLIGTMFHRALERMGRDALRGWDASRVMELQAGWHRALRGAGVSGEAAQLALRKLTQSYTTVLADARARWLLMANCEAHCEWAVSGWLGGELVQVIIDRTFVDDEVRWIVDYKTGEYSGDDLEGVFDAELTHHRHQLETYAALLYTLESRPVRLGLYFPLHAGWREWAYHA